MNAAFVIIFSLVLSNGWGLFLSQNSSPFFPNVFQLQSRLFSPKVTMRQFQQLSTRVRTLEVTVAAMQGTITSLQEMVANIRPTCPSTAPGARVIGNLCFSIETVPQTYDDAKSACFQNGGMLAEPRTNDDSFYSRLVTAFPVATNSLTTSELYVQIVAVGTAFVYESNNLVVSNTDPRWLTIPATPVANDAAALSPSGTNWRLIEVPNRNTETRPYICQYDTVI